MGIDKNVRTFLAFPTTPKFHMKGHRGNNNENNYFPFKRIRNHIGTALKEHIASPACLRGACRGSQHNSRSSVLGRRYGYHRLPACNRRGCAHLGRHRYRSRLRPCAPHGGGLSAVQRMRQYYEILYSDMSFVRAECTNRRQAASHAAPARYI